MTNKTKELIFYIILSIIYVVFAGGVLALTEWSWFWFLYWLVGGCALAGMIIHVARKQS